MVWSIGSNVVQVLIIDAKMMGHFVVNDAMDRFTYLFGRAGMQQDGHAVDADLVGQDEVVAVGPLGEWNAMVESEKLRPIPHPGLAHGLLIGPVLDDDVDVVHPAPELFGQGV